MAFMSAKNNGVICAFVDIIPVEWVICCWIWGLHGTKF
jgi:hypothetical protein